VWSGEWRSELCRIASAEACAPTLRRGMGCHDHDEPEIGFRSGSSCHDSNGTARWFHCAALNGRGPHRSKYPPAEPEALRLLAPQRGLIATGEKQKQLQRHEAREATGFGKNEGNSGRYTPGILKVWLPPRQSRRNSHFIRKVFGVGVPRDGWFCRARVGDHFVGRFWRSPPPTTGR